LSTNLWYAYLENDDSFKSKPNWFFYYINQGDPYKIHKPFLIGQ
jgi:hypothetical protein